MPNLVISDRLKAIADSVPAGSRVADIGCDHAYISIYLASCGIAMKVIAMDVAVGPLKIARENIRDMGLEDRVETRLSDGFAALYPGETDTAIISGMGGMLITDILEHAGDIITDGYRLILSPHSDIPHVRSYLIKNKYNIQKEIMIRDSEKLYNIIIAVFCRGASESEDSEADLLFNMFGEYHLNNPSDEFLRWFETEYSKRKTLIERLSHEKSEAAEKRVEEMCKEVGLFEKAMGIINGKG